MAALNVYTGDNAPTLFVNVALSQTDAPIVAAVPGRRIRVIQAALFGSAAAAGQATFKSKPAGAGSAISPALGVQANDEAVLPFSNVGWCDTKVGEGLAVDTAATGAVGILLAYTLV